MCCLQPGRAPKTRGRTRVLLSLLAAMLVASAPAVLSISTCAWLIDVGTNYEGWAFAWLLLILFAPITLAFSAAALVIDLFLLLAIVATLSGRTQIITPRPRMRSSF